MKKSVRIFALALVLVAVAALLASCGLSGKYSAVALGTGSTMEFDGKNVTIVYKVAGFDVATIDATYSIEDDTISFDFGDEEEIENDLAKAFFENLEEPVSFEEGEDYIKIGGVKYTKDAE
jgi:hypothetical protein